MNQTDLCFQPIHELAPQLRSGAVSPVEVTEAYLGRIEQLQPTLNAYITITAEAARKQAREAEAAIRSGDYRGPLHGVPIALKDIIATRGVRTTAGSKILADWVPSEDATVVERLHSAGAVILGKLNTHEFAFGPTTTNPHYGPARNPWATDRIAGGSSGGSGVAVAAGLCAAALGSDTGGSIRVPASVDGVVGLKQTFGRVSRYGVIPVSWSLDHVGPLTRSVRDAALVLAAIAGSDPYDPTTGVDSAFDAADEPVHDLQGVIVGVLGGYFDTNVQPEIAAAHAAAVALLREHGAEVEPVEWPGAELAAVATTVINLGDMSAYHERWLRERPQDYGRDVRVRLAQRAFVSAVHYAQSQRARTLSIRELRSVLERCDVVVTPTVPVATPRIGEDQALVTWPDGSTEGTRAALSRFTRPFNLVGFPALSLPCGQDSAGLPVGLQIVAKPFDEAELFRVALAYEQAAGWQSRRPPIDVGVTR